MGTTPAEEQCGSCFLLLDPSLLSGNQVQRCAGCGWMYHSKCWDRYRCANPGCKGKMAIGVTVASPQPAAARLIVNYPVVGGPVNFLTDEPLGVSCGTVVDGYEEPVVVRNNSDFPLALPPSLRLPWVTLRVVPKPADLPTAEGWQVIPPRDERDLSVRFHAVRPPSAKGEIRLAAISLPIGLAPAIPTAPVRIQVISRPPTREGIVFGGGGLLLLLVFHLIYLLCSIWNPERSVWWVSGTFALACAWFAAIAPNILLGPALGVAGVLIKFDEPASGNVTFYRVIGWLVSPEGDDWVWRRVGGAGTALVLAGLFGWPLWTAVLWLLAKLGSYTFPAILVSFGVIGLAVAGWEMLARVYGVKLVGPCRRWLVGMTADIRASFAKGSVQHSTGS